jgi:hypothetical protein
MRWIRSQVISSLMFQIVPLPVLAAGTAMQPTPAVQHCELRPISGAGQKTDDVVNLRFAQTGAVISRH